MTVQEAVADLTALKEYFEDRCDAFPVSLEFAISALRAQTDGDVISRQAAIDAVLTYRHSVLSAEEIIDTVPSAQHDRDIPIKPNEATDRTWGIHKRQAVCPTCDYYLGHVYFIGDGKSKKITYCGICGQAIDWEGWDTDG